MRKTQSFEPKKRKAISEKDSAALLHLMYLKRFEAEMYCEKEIFFEAIDYTGKRVSWRTFGDLMLTIDEEQHEKLLDFIECANFFNQDR